MAEDDFDLAGFDEAYSPSDFSTDDMNFATAVGQQTGGFGDDNTAQVIANQLAQPQVGLNRSNITNLVSIDPATGKKTDLYDPTFAAAFDISRGLDPTNNMGGTGGLAVPSYLRPQIESGRVEHSPLRGSSTRQAVICLRKRQPSSLAWTMTSKGSHSNPQPRASISPSKPALGLTMLSMPSAGRPLTNSKNH